MTSTDRGGFSLIEVLLATSILMACVIVLGHLATIGRRSARAAQDISTAQVLCETKMNELLAGAVPLERVDEVPLDDNGDWLVSVELEPTEHALLTAVRVTVTQVVQEQERPREFVLVRWIPGAGPSGVGDAATGRPTAPNIPSGRGDEAEP